MKDLIDMLAAAPSSEIDPAIVPRIAALNDSEDPAEDLQGIIDSCARYSLASSFAMLAMEATLALLKDEL